MNQESPLPISPRKVYSVSELTSEIKELLEDTFEHLWVEGEVSDVHLHSSGHLYFTLKDERSQIRTVMFRSQVRLLAFEPEDGMYVLCRGRVGVYEARGAYQLILDFMEPRGLGALLRAFDQLKDRLQKEGLFDPARKRPLPFLPRRIGIVTSPTGAAIRDMLQILGRRFPNLHILIRPTRVQGEGAAQEIAGALDDLNRLPDLDLIVLTRGGGSLEDLWAFNEEEVARAIARSGIPVVTGVGHEVDFTIADFVADLRAPTPSAAAEMIVPLRRDLEEHLKGSGDALSQCISRIIRERRDALSQWSKRISDPRKRVADQRISLDDYHSRLLTHMGRVFKTNQETLSHQRAMLLGKDPRERIQRGRMELEGLKERAFTATQAVLQTHRGAFEREVALLHSLSPLNVLGRGYSITRRHPTDEIVRDATTLRPGDRLRLTFHRGEASCRVDETHSKE